MERLGMGTDGIDYGWCSCPHGQLQVASILLHVITYISKTDQQCNWINPLNPSGWKTGHKRLSNVPAGPKTGHTTFEYNTGG